MLNPKDPKIIERYKALPQPLKDALWAEETIDHIFDVGKAQHLTVSQMGELADIVGLVILGILKPEDFGSEVQRKLNLTMERASAADAIVTAINEKIFAPLRQEILTVRTNADATRTGAEKPPATGKTSGVEEERSDGKTPDVKEVAVSSVLIAPSSTSDVQRTSDVHPGAAQPVSIFAKNIPEPPHYQGQDPYREPIDGEAPTSLQIPSPTPQAPLEARPLTGQAAQVGGPRQQQSSLAGEQAKPISWADISPEKEKASSPPDAKSALERAMNDGISPEKTNAQKYQGKDPYREPLNEQ